jgi:crotonobetainyl-CoA:carnitine CoA-transferase CaiB-like acyl-CoA transferase
VFAHLRVVELQGQQAAAVCGRFFAGFGAQVELIRDPALHRSLHERAWLDHGKTVGPELAEADLHTRLATADVIVDGRPPGALEALGLDLEALMRGPRPAVICRISPFGQSGPYRDFAADEISLYAISGLMNSTGDGARAPLNARPPIVSLSGGLYAFIACAMALLRRQRDGHGELIDLSLQEAAMQNVEILLAEGAKTGTAARRNGDRHALVPWRTYPCADGEATIIGGPMRHWPRVAPLFGQPELLQGPLTTAAGRIAERDRFEALIRPWLMTQTREALFHLWQAKGQAWSFIASLPEVLRDPQHAAREFFVSREVDGQALRLPGAPYRGSRLPWDASAASRPPPPLPQPSGTPSGRAPLAGLRVLDFTHDWAGPHAARVLADYGAEVVKIEYPGRLDGMRGAYFEKINTHTRFKQLHRNKRSLTLDLKQPDHLALCEALVRESDVVIENARAGVMAQLGLGDARLRELKPGIVMVSMSAFGASGPYRRYAGYGGTLEAISGAQSLTGYRDGETPYRVREMDVINGIFGISATLAALLHRAASGEGQHIDLSENETSVWSLSALIAEQSQQSAPLGVIGNRHPQFAPQGVFPCAGEDQWLSLCIRSDAEWARLAAWLGADAQPEVWNTAAARQRDADALESLIAARTRTQDKRALMAELQGLGLAAAPVFNSLDLLADPHLQARGWWQEAEGYRLPGFPFTLQHGGSAVRSLGPDLGADNAVFFGRLHPQGAAAAPVLNRETVGTAYESADG